MFNQQHLSTHGRGAIKYIYQHVKQFKLINLVALSMVVGEMPIR